MVPRSVYVHVPFCARRCSYCDFAVHAVRRPPAGEWLDAIERELAEVRRREGWGRLPLRTLYVGGGTPSLLGVGAMGELRRRLQRHADLDDAELEWTAEANPESLDIAVAADWAAAGVNRVSLGVQTFHEPALRWMGRTHGADGPGQAVAAARRAGIGNVSVDLIFGLPDRLERDWAADLERALRLEPEHVSLYGLTAEPGTPLGGWVEAGRERLPDEDAYGAQYLIAAARLASAGFLHYEVSNFARPGRESRHNAVYWTGGAYLGLGPGAHSHVPPRRRWNVRDWNAYREAVRSGGMAVAGEERVDREAAELERAWLSLRTRTGVRVEEAGPERARLAADWVRRGWAERFGATLRLTARGWLLLDRLAVEWEAAGTAPAAGPERAAAYAPGA